MSDSQPTPGTALNALIDAVGAYHRAAAAFFAEWPPDSALAKNLAREFDDAHVAIGPVFEAFVRSVGRPPLAPRSFDLLQTAELAISVAAAFTF